MPSFLDTNVLVYALAGGSDSKAVVAKRLLTRLLDEADFRTSTQVLQELFVTLTRKSVPSILFLRQFALWMPLPIRIWLCPAWLISVMQCACPNWPGSPTGTR